MPERCTVRARTIPPRRAAPPLLMSFVMASCRILMNRFSRAFRNSSRGPDGRAVLSPVVRSPTSAGNYGRKARSIVVNQPGYGSNKNLTVTVTWAATDLPLCVAGSYWYCLRASRAAFCKEGGPVSTFIVFTCPEGSTTASSVTLPVAKSRNASGEAVARTDLISFGGTIVASSEEGAAESGAAVLDGRGTVRFPTEAATTDFSCTTVAATAASRGAGGSGAASEEGPAPLAGAGCTACWEAALSGGLGALLARVVVPELECASGVV